MEVMTLAYRIVSTRRKAVLKVAALGIAASVVLGGQITPREKDRPVPALVLTLEASKHAYAAREKIQLKSVLRYDGIQTLRMPRGDADAPLEFYHLDIESPTPSNLPFSFRAQMTKTGRAHHEHGSFSVRLLRMQSGVNYKMEFNDISDEYDITQPGDYRITVWRLIEIGFRAPVPGEWVAVKSNQVKITVLP